MDTQHRDPEVPAHIECSTGPGPRIWLLRVKCPHCGDIHQHGGGDFHGEPLLGHRISHCVYVESGGYNLTDGGPDMPPPQPLTAGERRRLQEQHEYRTGQTGHWPPGKRKRVAQQLAASVV